jgi:Skp family chaperone for outer membrane proteins
VQGGGDRTDLALALLRFDASETQGQQTRTQQQVDRALNDALTRVITRSACSVVMERDNAYGWNNAMDITPATAREMDGALQAVTIQ